MMKMKIILCMALLMLSSAALAESGIASHYGARWHGKKMANGKPYDMNAMTCAHRKYPFGTQLKVIAGKKWTTCIVTDRGPFIRGRIIDLSKAGARQLGILHLGTARVTIEVIK